MTIPGIDQYWDRLEIAMRADPPVIVPKGRDEQEYFESIRAGIRKCATPAIQVTATVMEPGFDDKPLGTSVSGYLLAKNVVKGQVGYWLIYQPEEDNYYCFWGPDESQLGAYGVSGNPIYCWWD